MSRTEHCNYFAAVTDSFDNIIVWTDIELVQDQLIVSSGSTGIGSHVYARLGIETPFEQSQLEAIVRAALHDQVATKQEQRPRR